METQHPKLSVLIAPNRPLVELAHEAAELEAAGFAGVWVPDHLTGGTNFSDGPVWHAGMAALAAVIAATEQVQVGLLVAGAAVRSAATLGVELRGMNELAEGRLRCGVGAGSRLDTDLTGLPVAPGAALGRYVDEVAAHAGGVPLVVAANNPRSQRQAVDRRLDWVGYVARRFGSAGAPERFAELHATWRELGRPGRVLVLADISEPDPWVDRERLLAAYRLWVDSGVDELVWWSPGTYGHAPGRCRRAADLLEELRGAQAHTT